MNPRGTGSHSGFVPTPARPRGPARKRVLLALHYYDYRHHAGAARYAAEHGWILEDAHAQDRLLPPAWNGDGIISFHGSSPEFLEWVKTARVPVVDIGEYDEFSTLPRVKTDPNKIARLAVEHFAQRGYKSVAFTWEIDSPVSRRRGAAMRQAADALGLAYRNFPLKALGELKTIDGALPVGLLAVHDALAVRALSVLEDADIPVPEQAAVLGIDNFEYRCIPAQTPLSSIDPDQERVGYEAAALLDKLMTGGAPPSGPVLVPPRGIIERDSTRMLAVDDVEVARALRFIIAGYTGPIQLGDVADATGLSLRRLQTRFKASLGRTILQEINTRRVKHAQGILAATNHKIRTVAAEAGFGSAVKMIRVFKQYVGTSPKRYRRLVRKGEQENTRA
ncbi:MAG: substrate-binding domain-containing protein [Phycisphaerae bacterium]